MKNWIEPKKDLLSLGTHVKYRSQDGIGSVKAGYIVGYPTCVRESGDDGTYVLELDSGRLEVAWDSEISVT